MIYASAVILASVLLFEILVIKDSKKALYNAWKREFERELGSSPEKVDDIVIRELYETKQSPKSAAEYYKELNVGFISYLNEKELSDLEEAYQDKLNAVAYLKKIGFEELPCKFPERPFTLYKQNDIIIADAGDGI